MLYHIGSGAAPVISSFARIPSSSRFGHFFAKKFLENTRIAYFYRLIPLSICSRNPLPHCMSSESYTSHRKHLRPCMAAHWQNHRPARRNAAYPATHLFNGACGGQGGRENHSGYRWACRHPDDDGQVCGQAHRKNPAGGRNLQCCNGCVDAS